MFQRDVTLAHQARETIELLKVMTQDLIPPNVWSKSPERNPLDTNLEYTVETNNDDITTCAKIGLHNLLLTVVQKIIASHRNTDHHNKTSHDEFHKL